MTDYDLPLILYAVSDDAKRDLLAMWRKHLEGTRTSCNVWEYLQSVGFIGCFVSFIPPASVGFFVCSCVLWLVSGGMLRYNRRTVHELQGEIELIEASIGEVGHG